MTPPLPPGRRRLPRPLSPEILASVAVAVPVLAPYATYQLPYRQGLMAQAVAILLAVVALGLAAWGRSPHQSWEQNRERSWRQSWQQAWLSFIADTPRSVRWSLALYAGATALGTAVGWALGHSLSRIAGQALSMGLLPLAAIAALGLPRRALRYAAAAVVVTTGLPVLGHVAFSALRVVATGEPQRLYLPGGVSVTAPALLALTFALAFAGRRGLATEPEPEPGENSWWSSRAARRTATFAAALAAPLLLVYIAGAGVRGLWLVTAPAVVAASLLAAPRRARRRRLMVLTAVCVAGLVVALAAWNGAQRRLQQPAPNLLPGTYGTNLLTEVPPPGLEWIGSPVPGALLRRVGAWSGSETLVAHYGVAVPGPGLYRLTATVHSPRDAPAHIAVRWHDVWGQPLRYPPPELTMEVPPGPAWRDVEAFALAPPGTASAQLRLSGRGDETTHRLLRRVSLERIAEPEMGGVLVQAIYLRDRLASIFDPFGAGSRAMRASVSFRAEESRALLRTVTAAPWHRQLLGHGLGATFAIDTSVARPISPLLDPNELHYIHNFYLFLPFKLGLLGGTAALLGLLLWVPGRLRAQQRLAATERQGLDRRLVAAVLASWGAYLVWSLTSPEILSFRMAPLWGLMIALATRLTAPHLTAPAPAPAEACNAADEAEASA